MKKIDLMIFCRIEREIFVFEREKVLSGILKQKRERKKRSKKD